MQNLGSGSVPCVIMLWQYAQLKKVASTVETGQPGKPSCTTISAQVRPCKDCKGCAAGACLLVRPGKNLQAGTIANNSLLHLDGFVLQPNHTRAGTRDGQQGERQRGKAKGICRRQGHKAVGSTCRRDRAAGHKGQQGLQLTLTIALQQLPEPLNFFIILRAVLVQCVCPPVFYIDTRFTSQQLIQNFGSCKPA